MAGLLGEPGQPAEVTGLRGVLPFDITLAALRLRDARGVLARGRRRASGASSFGAAQGANCGYGVGRAPGGARPHAGFSDPRRERAVHPAATARAAIVPATDTRRILDGGQPRAWRAHPRPSGDFHFGRARRHRRRRAVGHSRAPRTAHRRISARLDLGTTLTLPDWALRLDLTGSETGGLVAAVTGRPEAGDLNFALHGDGPLADWHGRLVLDAQQLARVDLALRLGYGERKHLGLDGTADFARGLVPPELADALGTHADFALDMAEIGQGSFALQNLSLRAAGVGLVGKGSADLGADRLTGDMTLTIPDLAPLSGLATTPLAGKVAGKLAADGPLRRPALHVALDGADLRAAEAALARLTATLDLAVTEPLGDGPIAVRINGHGVAEGVRVADRPIADGRAALTLAGALPARGEAVLRELSLHTALGDIAAHGSIDRKTLAGTARVDARVPELGSVLTALAVDAPLRGALALGTDVTSSDRAQRIDIILDGGASGLSGLPPGAQELIGASPTLTAGVTVVPGTDIAVRNLAVAGSGVALEGEPRLALIDDTLGGELRLKIPDLAPLGPALGQPIAGSAGLRAALGGTLGVPKVDVDSSVERLALAGQSIERASLAGSVSGPVATPSGSASLGLTAAGKDAKLGLDYRLAGGTLALSGIELTAPATKLTGDTQVVLAGPLATGRLTGEVKDLGGLAPWTGQKLAGSATLELALATSQNRQDATFKVGASGVEGSLGTIRAANLTAAVADALGRPTLDADLRAEGFVRDGVAVDLATVTAKGGLATLAVRATATGSQAGQPFALDTVATLDLSGTRKTVRLTQLSGKAAGQPFSLGQPATVTLDGPAVALDRLDLAYGPARVQGGLDLGANRIAGDLALAALPLASLRPFGAPPLAGTLGAKLNLSGTRKAPAAHLDATLAKLALDPASKVRADAQVGADLQGGRLDATATATGLGSAPLTVQLGLPATFGLDPPAFALSETAALSGRIAGPVDLARAARFAALAGTQLAGALQTDLDPRRHLAGTPARWLAQDEQRERPGCRQRYRAAQRDGPGDGSGRPAHARPARCQGPDRRQAVRQRWGSPAGGRRPRLRGHDRRGQGALAGQQSGRGTGLGFPERRGRPHQGLRPRQAHGRPRRSRDPRCRRRTFGAGDRRQGSQPARGQGRIAGAGAWTTLRPRLRHRDRPPRPHLRARPRPRFGMDRHARAQGRSGRAADRG